MRLAPNDADAHRTLGRIASFRGDLNTANAELKKAVELQPKRADLHDELGSVLAQNFELEEAATAVFRGLAAATGFARKPLCISE